MSSGGSVREEVTKGLGQRGPVTGTVPRHDVVGRGTVLASRREAVLRVLQEAYRRDAGPRVVEAQ